jgi:predicted alpha-1,2-mannosidase
MSERVLMKRLTVTLTAIAATVGFVPAPAFAADTVNPADLVNPFIGSTNLGNTYPGATTPFGMLAWSPQTSRGNQVSTPAPGGYQYTATRIRGLSLTHLNGVGCSGGNGDIPVMPYVGAVDSSPTADTTDAKYASTFAHTNEQASPGYYKVGLDSGATMAVTTTPRTGSADLTFPAAQTASVLFRTSNSETGSTDATVHIDPATRTVNGSVTAGNFCGPQSENNRHDYYTLYFTAQFDTPFTTIGTWTDGTLAAGSTDAHGGTGYGADGRANPGQGSGGFVSFAPGTTEVGLKVAVSYVDLDHARNNLRAENPPRKSFDQVHADARRAWNDALRAVEIGGGSADQRTVFYTALYHAMLEPTLTSDVNGEYLGADRKAHRVERGQRAQYGTFSGWDVYRAQVQLLALVQPRVASDFAQSLYNFARQRGGEWDRWLLENGKTSVMSGDPSAAALSSMYAFGARDFDVRGALDSLVTAATVPTANDHSDAGCPVECVGQRPALDKYLSLGYVPSDNCSCWGGAAETLEDAAADYALSTLAAAQGRPAVAREFARRSGNWRNVFDPTAQADPGLPNNIRLHVTEVKTSGENPPSEIATNLVDGDLGTKWLTFATTGWVSVKLDTPLSLSTYALTSANDEPTRDPRDWRLEGSNDGTTWTTVDSQSGQSFADRGVTNTYAVNSTTPYQYYRINVTANGGAPIVQLAELQLANPAIPTPPPNDSPYVGWMRDRYAGGQFVEGFSPSTERGFVEGTSARYTWMVYNDVTELARLMGGNAVAVRRLDDFFRKPDGTFDFTAAKGTRYDPTNEPDIQTPYIYNALGAPRKTQETVRAEIDQLWTNTTGGIPGNDDAGTMSAWLVWSALGLYPSVPGRAELSITTPLFSSAVVHLGRGHELRITTSGAGAHIRGLRLDGWPMRSYSTPAALVRTGGRLDVSLTD